MNQPRSRIIPTPQGPIYAEAGIQQEAQHKYGTDPAEAARPGEHLWMMMAMYRVSDPDSVFGSDAQLYMDLENLLSIDGPGCYICEQMYSPEVAALPCPGEPR